MKPGPFAGETVTIDISNLMFAYAVQRSRSYRKGIAADIMAPFRWGIKYRTEQEMKSARRRVVQCEAHFQIVACGGETCEGCFQPFWQHILTTSARYCPMDGRPYWQLARAIFMSEGLTESEVREAITPIARDAAKRHGGIGRMPWKVSSSR